MNALGMGRKRSFKTSLTEEETQEFEKSVRVVSQRFAQVPASLNALIVYLENFIKKPNGELNTSHALFQKYFVKDETSKDWSERLFKLLRFQFIRVGKGQTRKVKLIRADKSALNTLKIQLAIGQLKKLQSTKVYKFYAENDKFLSSLTKIVDNPSPEDEVWKYQALEEVDKYAPEPKEGQGKTTVSVVFGERIFKRSFEPDDKLSVVLKWLASQTTPLLLEKLDTQEWELVSYAGGLPEIIPITGQVDYEKLGDKDSKDETLYFLKITFSAVLKIQRAGFLRESQALIGASAGENQPSSI
eukprot:augustus_masked-scaffold_1-processed-gene-31.56-mRNA-1 protein AED:1.00 eAED:1.00 QI:0/-1/0/0/-1/1/1/0/300